MEPKNRWFFKTKEQDKGTSQLTNSIKSNRNQ